MLCWTSSKDLAANNGPKNLQDPYTLKSWSMDSMFLLFGQGGGLCCVVLWDTQFVGHKIIEISLKGWDKFDISDLY